MSYFFIGLTIFFTVCGQLMLKWKVIELAPSGVNISDWSQIIRLLLNPWIILSLALAFIASICWMTAVSRLPLSKAYPFMALSFPLVSLFAILFFRETVSAQKLIGISFIVIGVIFLSRSSN